MARCWTPGKDSFLPTHVRIFGYARTSKSDDEFRETVRGTISQKDHHGTDFEQKLQEFLGKCMYRHGQYDSAEDVARLIREVDELERCAECSGRECNRIFYFALPPKVYVPAARTLKQVALSSSGWNRLILEKPFGEDYDSAVRMANELGELFDESQLYRIDHYLGKELVQNLIVQRFGNLILEPLWNRNYIDNIQITFKENFGTEGRGGYFDSSGIIRDIMQNHLMQILTLVAMEPPVKVSGADYSDYLRDAKNQVLQCIPPLTRDDVIIGQYVAADGKPGYLDDDTVPKDSICPTFCVARLRIHNQRWEGVPFIMKAGKALDERKGEIRIQFKDVPAADFMFDGQDTPRNELVIRFQPDESVYMKLNIKGPGLRSNPTQSELDLNYKTRYPGVFNPDAYTRLILDVIRGKQATFVRTDELLSSWKIFTPLLHELEREKVKPIPYPYGSRGPPEADEMIASLGYRRATNYRWHPSHK